MLAITPRLTPMRSWFGAMWQPVIPSCLLIVSSTVPCQTSVATLGAAERPDNGENRWYRDAGAEENHGSWTMSFAEL
jgi:hypothetical protein